MNAIHMCARETEKALNLSFKLNVNRIKKYFIPMENHLCIIYLHKIHTNRSKIVVKKNDIYGALQLIYLPIQIILRISNSLD